MASYRPSTQMVDHNMDAMSLILMRLDALSLTRAACTCRLWYATTKYYPSVHKPIEALVSGLQSLKAGLMIELENMLRSTRRPRDE